MVIHQIKDKAQYEAALGKHKVINLEISDTRLMPSRWMAVFNRRMSEEYPKAYHMRIEPEKTRHIHDALNIHTLPTFLIYKDGKKINEIIGKNQKGLENAIREALNDIETTTTN